MPENQWAMQRTRWAAAKARKQMTSKAVRLTRCVAVGNDMMQKMQQAMGQDGQGQSGANGSRGRDPLGRQQGTGDSLNDDVKIPGEIDIQRAREILDEIRRKLGNALTPQMEKEYLQRLLKFD